MLEKFSVISSNENYIFNFLYIILGVTLFFTIILFIYMKHNFYKIKNCVIVLSCIAFSIATIGIAEISTFFVRKSRIINYEIDNLSINIEDFDSEIVERNLKQNGTYSEIFSFIISLTVNFNTNKIEQFVSQPFYSSLPSREFSYHASYKEEKFYFYFDGMTNEKHIDVYSFDEIYEYNKKVDYNIIKKTLDLKGEITFTYLGETENNSINGYVYDLNSKSLKQEQINDNKDKFYTYYISGNCNAYLYLRA